MPVARNDTRTGLKGMKIGHGASELKHGDILVLADRKLLNKEGDADAIEEDALVLDNFKKNLDAIEGLEGNNSFIRLDASGGYGNEHFLSKKEREEKDRLIPLWSRPRKKKKAISKRKKKKKSKRKKKDEILEEDSDAEEEDAHLLELMKARKVRVQEEDAGDGFCLIYKSLEQIDEILQATRRPVAVEDSEDEDGISFFHFKAHLLNLMKARKAIVEQSDSSSDEESDGISTSHGLVDKKNIKKGVRISDAFDFTLGMNSADEPVKSKPEILATVKEESSTATKSNVASQVREEIKEAMTEQVDQSMGISDVLDFIRKRELNKNKNQILAGRTADARVHREDKEDFIDPQDVAMPTKGKTKKFVVNIEHLDQFNRPMTKSEAYREISRIFHGKAPSHRKLEKKIREYQKEQKVYYNQNNLTESLQRSYNATKELGQAHLLLDSRNKGLGKRKVAGVDRVSSSGGSGQATALSGYSTVYGAMTSLAPGGKRKRKRKK